MRIAAGNVASATEHRRGPRAGGVLEHEGTTASPAGPGADAGDQAARDQGRAGAATGLLPADARGNCGDCARLYIVFGQP